LDISEGSVEEILSILGNLSKGEGKGTIVWSGPMGQFENPDHRKGTMEIAKAISESSAFKIVGGGNTVTALDLLGLVKQFDFISTGGGAMLEFLAEGKLLGIDALNYKTKLLDWNT